MADTNFNSLNPQLDTLFSNLEQQHNLPAGLLKSVAYTESRYNNNATSKTGAQGMFQFMPATAKQYNVDVSDPVSSAKGAAQMYSDLLKANGGDLNKALAGYNWGQGNLNRNGLDKAPTETRNYISQINKLMGNGASDPNLKQGADNAPPPEAIQAYLNMIKGSQGQANNQEDGVPPPEAIQAYLSMMQQAQQQPQGNQPLPQQIFTPQGNNNPNTGALGITQQQTPQQVAQSNQALGIVQQKQGVVQGNMNQQSGQIAYNPQANVRSQLYNTMVQYSNDPAKLGDFYNTLSPNEKTYVNQMLRNEYLKTNNGEEQGVIANLWQGITNSAQKTNDSIKQIGGAIASKITGNQDYVNEANRNADTHRAVREMYDAMNPSTARDIGEVTGDIGQFVVGGEVLGGAKATGALAKGATSIGAKAPGIAGEALGSNLATRAVDLGLQGAGASVIQNPVANAKNANDVLGGKVEQGATGAVLGAGIGIPAEKALGGIVNKVEAFKGANKALPQADQEAIELANKQGIQLMANDLPSASNSLIKQGQDLTNSNNVVNRAVGQQQQGLNQAVQDAIDKVGKADSTKIADETGLNKILQDKNNPYYYRANEINEKIQNINPNDPNAILKASAEAQLIGRKNTSNQLYKNADDLLPQNTQVSLNNAYKVAKDAQDFLDNLATPTQKNQFKGVVNDLNSIIENAKKGNNTFGQINQFFREVGDNARQAMRAGDEQGARFYNQFKTALNKDKEDFINSLPNSAEVQAYKNAYDTATNYNRENVQAIKQNKLQTIFEPYQNNGMPNIPDGIIDKWVKKGDISRVQTIFDNLPPSGQQAVQDGVINKILSNVYDSNGNVIPSKLIKNYQAYTDPSSGNTPLTVVLNKDAKKAFDDLMTTMGRLQNIGVYKNNPQTGVKALPGLKNIENLGAVATAPHTYGLSLLKPISDFMKSGLLAKGLTDPKYQKILINLNNANPSSPAYLNKVGDMVSYLSQNYLQK